MNASARRACAGGLPNSVGHRNLSRQGAGLASIFLSYARDDAARAKALATVLERAGHKVWWDRHISGGSEYSDEIEAALKDADVVLVLWSRASVRSAWVRDEAAEGRDSGRLVPVLLDDSAPPLGFRQVQSIPIAGWSARGNPPNWQELLKAVAARAGVSGADAEPASDARPRRRPIVIAGIALLAALLIAAGAWFMFAGRSTASATPVLAVLPFADLSPQGDKGYLAEGVAEAILTGLAKDPGIKVIGRSSAKQLHDAGAAAPDMRRAMGITHVLEGTARSIGDQLRMSVRLINAADGQQVWAEEYSRKLDNIFAVQDEIGRAVAEKLKGSFAGTRLATQQTSADAYTLYLAARAKMRDRRISSLKEATALARQVIAKDPNYAPGHAIYAELIEHMSYDNYGTMPPERARKLALPHARKAIALAPNSAEGYAALGMILDGEPAIAPLRKAIQLDPARGELRLWLAGAYNVEGRNQEAFNEVRAGAEMEPLWATMISAQAGVLAASERYAEAEAVLSEFERRGGSVARATKTRSDIAGWYRGDLSQSLELLRHAAKADPELPLANQSFAFTYGSLGFPEQAKAAAKTLPRYTALYAGGDFAAVADAGRRDGKAVWLQPDPDIVIDALAIERDWAAIEKLFDANPKSLDLVCRDNRNWNVQMGVNLMMALNERGRTADADRMRDCLTSGLRKTSAGPIRAPYMSNNGLRVMWAQMRALEGKHDEAFALLDQAASRGMRTWIGSGLSHYPPFDRMKADPRYARIDARLKQSAAREAAEVRQLLASAN